MKLDCLTCTKYIHFAENLLALDSYTEMGNVGTFHVYDAKYFVERSEMTTEEAIYFSQKFRKVGLITHSKYIGIGGQSKTIEDVIKDKLLRYFVGSTKKTYLLKGEPLLAKRNISPISKQLEPLLEKDALPKIIRTFGTSDKRADELVQLYTGGDYSLTDFLFRLSYSEESLTKSLVPLTFALAELLNPIYYQSELVDATKRMYLHIDKIVKPIFNFKHYQEWLNRSSKYIEIENKEKSGELDSEVWIKKDKDGNYYFDGTKVFIKNKKAKYVQIFDVVFSLVRQGGDRTYSQIVTGGRVRELKINKKQIQRALTGRDANFFRYVTTIPQQVGMGVPLFIASTDGKTLSFNNKK